MRFSFSDRSELARLHRLLMPTGGWNIPRKKKWCYLLRVLREGRTRDFTQPSRFATWLDFWTDGDYQPENNQRSPESDWNRYFDFWTDGTDWVDAPEAIDNTDSWELTLQSLGRLERLKLKLQMKQAWRLYPLKNDIILPPSPRYDRFAYFEERQRKKQQAAERRRMPYQPKRERPIFQQIREGLEREFAWAITKRKEQEQYWLQKRDPDNSLKRCLAPHLSTRNMRTEEIEQQISAMSEAEWQQLLELVPLTTLKDRRARTQRLTLAERLKTGAIHSMRNERHGRAEFFALPISHFSPLTQEVTAHLLELYPSPSAHSSFAADSK